MQGNKQTFLTVGSSIFLLLVIVNISLFMSNQAVQNQITERAQYIQQSLQLEKIYQPLVHALADLAANRHDAQINALLNEQGISVTVTPPTAQPAPTKKRQG
ncbi:hypothetical protein [Sulfurirhabdus autotrophica]|uniref:Uncharacterized protein n=1 Tax=Sulfurirhabdus autotrophica TaxID=1706046 RepID=A0A4R3YIX2_9PROT|nr:hypothetical protein [Sulfurirhabdus autotrophica]TCV90633.1 hypothetical protein EDC63_101607 [Sulfurirhabdus autotrophica]